MASSQQERVLVALVAAVLFLAPFLVLAACYRGLPPEIGVLRIWIGQATLGAAKSPFMVFRVPAMNSIHGLMAAVMLTQSGDFENARRRTAYRQVFWTLLITIGIKSNFEAIEAIPPAIFGSSVNWLGTGALATVIIGLGVALYRSRGVPLPWPELRLTTKAKFALAALFAGYLAIVCVSILASHRA